MTIQSTTGSQPQRDERVAAQAHKAEQFRTLHVRGNPLVLFNIWDTGSAKAVAAAGAKAIATSSWAVAAANGFADGEHLPRALLIETVRRILGGIDRPLTVDLESGYGDTPEALRETIELVLDMGVVGCNLEDSYPADGRLRETADQVDRIRQVRQAADAAHIPLFINARTDVFFQRPPEQHDVAMVAQAVERARAYTEAGADGLFAPGLTDIALIGRLAEASTLPLNIMVVDTTPHMRALAEQGVARVSYGPRPYLLAMKALEQAARSTA
jgi:2-methylisocitrate lyase-like PEP mutase family enzyme